MIARWRTLLLLGGALLSGACRNSSPPDPPATAQAPTTGDSAKDAPVVFGAERLFHPSASALTFAGAGNGLISGGGRGMLRLWDGHGRRQGFTNIGNSRVKSVDAFGDSVVATTRYGPAHVFRVSGGFTDRRELTECGDSYPTKGVRFLADGKRVAVGFVKKVCIVELAGDAVVSIPSPASVQAIESRADGGLFILDAEGVKQWRGQGVALEPVAAIEGDAFAVSASGNRIAVISERRHVTVVDPASGDVETLQLDLKPDAVAISPDGRRLAIGAASPKMIGIVPGDAAILPDPDENPRHPAVLYDLTTKSVIARLGDHGYWVAELAFSRDGTALASTGEDPDRIQRFTLRPPGPLTPEDAKTPDAVKAALPSANGRRVVATVTAGVAAFDVSTAAPVHRLRRRDRPEIATAAQADAVALWTPYARRVEVFNEGIAGPARAVETPIKITAAALSPDGGVLVTAGEDTIAHAWQTVSGKLRLELQREFDGFPTSVDLEIDGVGVSKGGTRIAIASFAGIQVWDGESGKSIVVLPPHGSTNQLALSEDGQWLATVAQGDGDPALRVWGPPNYTEVHAPLEGDTGYAVAISSNGQRVAAVAGAVSATGDAWLDGTIQVLRFDGQSFVAEKTLTGHAGSVRAVALLADDTRVLSSSTDGTARLWTLD